MPYTKSNGFVIGCITTAVVPGSLTSPGGNADVADSSVGGDDDGLVITAPQKWEDL